MGGNNCGITLYLIQYLATLSLKFHDLIFDVLSKFKVCSIFQQLFI